MGRVVEVPPLQNFVRAATEISSVGITAKKRKIVAGGLELACGSGRWSGPDDEISDACGSEEKSGDEKEDAEFG